MEERSERLSEGALLGRLAMVLLGMALFGFASLWMAGMGTPGATHGLESGLAGTVERDPLKMGQKIYGQYCVLCHQKSGAGLGNTYPPLAGSDWVKREGWRGDNHLAQVVLHGLTGPVTVSGKTYNNAMAPWGNVLSDEQIAAVLTYVRTEWGDTKEVMPAEFVARVRASTPDRVKPWTEKELQAMPRELAEPGEKKELPGEAEMLQSGRP